MATCSPSLIGDRHVCHLSSTTRREERLRPRSCWTRVNMMSGSGRRFRPAIVGVTRRIASTSNIDTPKAPGPSRETDPKEQGKGSNGQSQPPKSGPPPMMIVDDKIDRESTIVLPPPDASAVDSSYDSLLVFIPGALKPPAIYREVCEKIQTTCASSGMRLWVVIPGFMNNLSTEKSVGLAYDEAIKLAEEDGRFEAQQGQSGVSDRIYIAGHSWGGITARPICFRRARALICLASSIGGLRMPEEYRDNSLEVPETVQEWPKPVLTVAGELDGQFRMPYAALQRKDVQSMASTCAEPPLVSVADKSVVVIRGLNHAQFCDGDPNIARGDIVDGIGTLEEGLERVAGVVSDFILADRVKSAEAAGRLLQAVDDTDALVKAYLDATCDGVNVQTAVDVQVSVSQGLIDQKDVSVRVHKDVFDSFVYSKAVTIKNELSGNRAFVRTHCWEEEDNTHQGGRKNSRNRASSLLWLKLRSLKHLMEVTNKPVEQEEEEGLAGMQSNERMLKLALDMVSPHARERYEKYGRKIRFIPDHRVDPGPPWLSSPVKYSISPDDGALEVSCPFCSTPTNAPPRFAGMFYVKIFSLGLMVEYILVDAFCAAKSLEYIPKE